MGHIGLCSHPTSSEARCYLQGFVAALGPGVTDDVLSTQATGIHNIDNCVVFCKSVRSAQWLQELLESLAVLPGLATRDQGRQWWWAWYTQTQLQRLATGTCVVTQANRRHTHNDNGQNERQGPGPPMGALVAAGTLAVSICSCAFQVSPYTQKWRPVARLWPVGCMFTTEDASYC